MCAFILLFFSFATHSPPPSPCTASTFFHRSYNVFYRVRHSFHKYLICCCCYWYFRCNNNLFQFVDLMYRSNYFSVKWEILRVHCSKCFRCGLCWFWSAHMHKNVCVCLPSFWVLLSVDINDDALGAHITTNTDEKMKTKKRSFLQYRIHLIWTDDSIFTILMESATTSLVG